MLAVAAPKPQTPVATEVAAGASVAPSGVPRPDAEPSRITAPRDDGLQRALASAVLHRAGARAVPLSADALGGASVLQRSIKVGTPGGATDTYNTLNAATLTLALTATLNRMPAWVAGWLPGQLAGILGAPVEYAFDEPKDVVHWVLLREVLDQLEALMTAPGQLHGLDERGKHIRAMHRKLEPERLRFVAAGNQNGTFGLFGLTYHLQHDGVNHYYISRPKGATVVYSGLERSTAHDIVMHLGKNGRDAPYGGRAEDVDDFVCAFFAETTRWSPERVLNLLAVTVKSGGGDVLTGSESPHALPMAAGSTWDKNLGVIGRQTPKRALKHAESEWILGIILQELNPPAANFADLVTGVKKQLTLTK